jgi:branched-subunit amino acid ABC-type transport system permease component
MNYVILGILGSPDYALVAIGFVFIFSVVKAYPFHQGAVLVLGTYVFLFFYQYTNNVALGLVALIVSILILSLLISRFGFEPLLGRHFPSIILGFAILDIIQSAASQYFYNGTAITYPNSVTFSGAISLGPINIDRNRLIAFLSSLIIVIILDQFFRRTRSGMGMRAVADSRMGAELCGINARWSIRGAFLLAGVAAAAGGVLLGLQQPTVTPQLATSITIDGLAAALLGGSTNLRGAVAAAVVISVVNSLAIGYVSTSLSTGITFIVIIAVLLVRPHGIFGVSEASRA